MRRVKDNLTPLGVPLTRLTRWRSVAADPLANFPEQAEDDITLPDLPHAREV
jgi:hypothetical protein